MQAMIEQNLIKRQAYWNRNIEKVKQNTKNYVAEQFELKKPVIITLIV